MGLREKINTDKFIVGIIGMGYVGLPLALEFAAKGIKVIGFDLDPSKVKTINKDKKSYIKHISSKRIKEQVDRKTLFVTSDFSKLSVPDVVIICVPTPLNVNREPDLSYVMNSTKEVAKYLRKGTVDFFGKYYLSGHHR